MAIYIFIMLSIITLGSITTALLAHCRAVRLEAKLIKLQREQYVMKLKYNAATNRQT